MPDNATRTALPTSHGRADGMVGADYQFHLLWGILIDQLWVR